VTLDGAGIPVKAGGSRRVTDLVVVGIIYVLALAGAWMFLARGVSDPGSFPVLESSARILLLAIPSLALLSMLVVSVVRMAISYRRGVWGARTRLQLLSLFFACAAAAALPPVLLLGDLARRAVESPVSASVREALAEAQALALSYYAGKDHTLRFTAENDLPRLVARYRADSDGILRELGARDTLFCSLELFQGGSSLSFAGDSMAKSEDGTPPATKNGFLPRLSAGGSSYTRYFVKDAGKVDTGTVPETVSALVSMKFPPSLNQAAGAIAATRTALEDGTRIAGSISLYTAMFSFTLIFPLFALTLLFAMGASDMILRPVSAMNHAIRSVRTGERRVRFLAKPGDETGRLMESFNLMLDELERRQGAELRSEKITLWRDMARRLAHELRNPLTPIRLSAERILKRWKADPASAGSILEASMVAIVQETMNMEALLTEFRDFARLPDPEKDWVKLRPLVEEVAHLYSASWPLLSMDTSGIDPETAIKVDRGHIKQVLGNLIANAAEATGGTGRIWIASELVKTPDCRYCRILFRDNGRGIPPELRDKVFLPYFSTKADGTGLGLAIVEHIVVAHGGRIRYDSAEGTGTVFYIDLPRDEETQ
jgi:two-component system, NtrC family, nitrogen regulation sensor histidine kinase NtrY